MQPLEALAREAVELAEGGAGSGAGHWPRAEATGFAGAAEAEAARVLQICNACRYCEGFCAVFPAMTRRLAFDAADLHYLANLCHNCSACLHACQYAPPHEFAVNVPRTLAVLRRETYSTFAWPAPLGRLYQRNGLVLALALVVALALFLMLAVASTGTLWDAPRRHASFYGVFPHGLMVGLFAPVFIVALGALGLGVRRFWRQRDPGPTSAAALREAATDALRLRYLDGGHGQGCNEDGDAFTLARRRFHHLTFYGFLLCFAATGTATAYHYLLGWPAPYAMTSLPKLLGTVGGVSMLVGTAGLFALHLRRHPLQRDPAQRGMDRSFIALLFLTAASGLALMLARHSAGMPVLLCLHLACVMALFATLPYSKFAHGAYRAAALLKWAIERRQARRMGAADE